MQRRVLSASERLDWLRLTRSENVGPVTFFALLRHFGSAAAALAGAPDLARRGGRKSAIRLGPKADAEFEIERLAAIGGALIAACEPGYPSALAAIHDPPPVLAVRGRADLLAKPCVAVVGARNASANGRRFARHLAAGVGRHGYVVVSGFARGIDGEAHRGALATGTVAVMAGGLDIIYPAEHGALYGEIADAGCIVSEQPLGTEPQARHFPRRNRLVSGLSRGVVVVEAAKRSGSLITARLALEQGREVFAVPGSPLDPRARGPNDLIRQGATLTESADDVVQGLGGFSPGDPDEPGPAVASTLPKTPADEGALPAARRKILERLGPTPVPVDELLRQCQVSAPHLATVLLELELAGRLERSAGSRIALLVDPDRGGG